MRNRTTFVIAHRLSTVRAADQILVLEAGKLVAVGTHEELLATTPLYRDTYALQLQSDDDTGGPPSAPTTDPLPALPLAGGDVGARPREYRASHDIEADIRAAQRLGGGLVPTSPDRGDGLPHPVAGGEDLPTEARP
jgi:ABC-type multidrug transport system ATPase subunit